MDEEKDQHESFPTLIQKLSPEQAQELQRSILELVKSSIKESVPPALAKGLKHLGYSKEVAGLVQLLAARSNDAKEDVLEKALTLYGLALDAREKGNRLAILNPDDVIVHEVTGFEPVGNAR